MIGEDFDAWRDRYKDMTFEEHREFYRQLLRDHPSQRHFNQQAAESFFWTTGDGRPIVFEMGGWNGELAGLMLSKFPSILQWDNYEIAPVEHICQDLRYGHPEMRDFVWNSNIDMMGYDTIVASHVLEHLSQDDLHRFLEMAEPGRHKLYIDMPTHSNWAGATASHILPFGIDGVAQLLKTLGFSCYGMASGINAESRWFA